MKCLHCLVAFHADARHNFIGSDKDDGWFVRHVKCPSCDRLNLLLVNAGMVSGVYGSGGYSVNKQDIRSEIAIRPFASNRPPCPPEVPQHIAEDYSEACLVLPFSAKASAALSRRCLQALLRDAGGVTNGDLSKEIQQVLDKGNLPTGIAESIDAIRQLGNFSAHPMKSQSTGAIVEVEPHEAEWNLEVLESLFDFYYVQPAILAKKRAALNAKIQDAGKPPMK